MIIDALQNRFNSLTHSYIVYGIIIIYYLQEDTRQRMVSVSSEIRSYVYITKEDKET